MFELEQKIMDCWGIVEDLHTLEASDNLPQLKSALVGVAHLYELKFNQLWELFEAEVQARADLARR